MSRLSRRRQRSVRATVAVALLALATVGVLLALPTGSVPALSVAAVFAVAAGWAAARIFWTEVLQSWRDAAADRARQAAAYRILFTDQADGHAAFATAMTDRLADRDREVGELEATLRLSERRATDAEERVRREARRAADAQERVAELEVALEIRTAEEADELATWDVSGQADVDTVVDLLAWEDRTQAQLGARIAEQRDGRKRA